MKKYVLLVALALICLPARGQLIKGYGFKVGLTSSNIRVTDFPIANPLVDNRHRHTGYAAFAFIEWSGLSFLSFVTEAGYVQRGYIYDLLEDPENPLTFGFRAKIDLNYLSTATLVKMTFLETPIAPYVLVGPRLDILVKRTPKERNTEAQDFTSVAAGGLLGAGVEMNRLAPVSLFLEIRYSFDVTNSWPGGILDVYNNAFDVLIGVKL